ncbi:MAG: T9SS C-terminal target domain-containing protein [Sphingobacteriales bacterium]|nr:MAG: T9SS C-terminal target domain-containing protein [Sphingobacteriales bacterium]
MKNKVYTLLKRSVFAVLLSLTMLVSYQPAMAQCPGTSTTASANWDLMDYLVTSGNYSGYVTTAMAETQGFAIGRNRFTITYPSATITNNGEATTNTAETGSFGTGADVSYSGNGTVTIVFDSVVRNVQFSLYDIDISQIAAVTATDGSGVPIPLNITMSVLTAGRVIIAGSGTATPVATADGNASNNSDTRGTLNISIAGNSPVTANGVKTININLSGTAGNWFLSDITACVYNSFPTNYYADARPFTGQPAYILATPDSNTVSFINVATGAATFLFQDLSTPRYVNGMGYDHKGHNMYYVYDYTSTPASTKSIRKYDYNTETMSTFVSDVNTLGIPSFNRGVESAGCCYYDSCLYFGVEGNGASNNAGRETIIWRIKLNAAGSIVNVAQVFAVPADDGAGTALFDWNDFTINNGILYNFDGANGSGQANYYHYNLQTGNLDQNYTGMPAYNRPRQNATLWDGTIYWAYDSIGVYNGAGGVGPKTKITGTGLNWTPGLSPGIGASGDAAGPFRPKSDFGDAPASYDPDPLAPATHEYNVNLRLGASCDREFVLTSSSTANADGADEDGMGAAPALLPGFTNYFITVSAYNNTGANANLVAWLDYDRDGVFEASEAQTAVVSTSGTAQNINLSWLSITVPPTTDLYTFLRVRIAPTASGMGAANMNGWYADGEVEDYPVLMGWLVAKEVLTFNAEKNSLKEVDLDWAVEKSTGITNFEIQKSTDGATWLTINNISSKQNNQPDQYYYHDKNKISGTIYYRIKLNYADGASRYTAVKALTAVIDKSFVTVSPNPTKGQVTIQVNASKTEKAGVQITDNNGKTIWLTSTELITGNNSIKTNCLQNMPNGVYYVNIIKESGNTVHKILLKK